MARAVQPENVEGVGQAIEAQAARDRDDVAAVDEPPPEPALAFDMLIEMHPRRVLEQAGGELVLGLLYGLPVDMVDLVAGRVIAPPFGRAGQHIVVAAHVERRQGRAEGRGIDAGGKLRHHGVRRRRVNVALIDHHPARKREHGVSPLVPPRRAHIDGAALLI